ncbi:amidohydrolase [Streptomyces sp. NPDC020096]
MDDQMRAVTAGLDNALRDELAEAYRDLHSHPELSFQEHRTSRVIARELAADGYEVTTEVGRTGVVAVLRNGPGPTVLARADIDALPVAEQTGLPYASTVVGTDPDGTSVPVMHACGHDLHTVWLLGAARLLAAARQHWSGTLLLVFQPAEELVAGAAAMVADGLFDRFGTPVVTLAQHVVGALPAGVVAYRTGTLMAASDSLRVRVFGRGGHASRPDATIDPVVIAAAIVLRLQTIVARELAPAEAAVVTVGSIQAGTKDNIIPDTADLHINVRSFDEAVRDRVLASVERIVKAEANASGAVREPELTLSHSAPLLTCPAQAVETTIAAIRAHLGPDQVRLMPDPISASEDFGVLGTAAGAPSVYWCVGGTDPRLMATGDVPYNHSPHFAPTLEPTLATGVHTMVAACLAWLGSPQP